MAANIYMLDEMQKMMRIPFWSPEIGPNGSWLPMYVNVQPCGSGLYSGTFPTIAECKAELKRSLSWISELTVEPELYYIKIPPQGEAMPTVPVPEGDHPLADEWVVNDRTALYIITSLPEFGYPLECDMMQNREGEKKDAKDSVKDVTIPESDTSSIKGWVHAKSAKDTQKQQFSIDEVYKLGVAAGMQKQMEAASSSA
ncbi:unnamed protein product [Prorocentrum cordatum]|uniref:Uncharacterized protein n=1 Tax=Prorocentrum cordatum TaxID=2364126 RepID=A0ABN9SFV1_9DINO|nr:unnamed protein product [Polarella glacialis]